MAICGKLAADLLLIKMVSELWPCLPAMAVWRQCPRFLSPNQSPSSSGFPLCIQSPRRCSPARWTYSRLAPGVSRPTKRPFKLDRSAAEEDVLDKKRLHNNLKLFDAVLCTAVPGSKHQAQPNLGVTLNVFHVRDRRQRDPFQFPAI